MKLRRLTPAGITKFHEYLDLLETEPTRLAPTWVLESPDTSEPLGSQIEIEKKVFGTRFAAAAYLDKVLAQTGISEVEKDTGLWSWLVLFYFDEVCPADSSKERNPGERARYIPDVGNFQRYYRHLLAGPVRIYRAHKTKPERALAVLCQPLNKPGDIVEQLASRQELVTNAAVMEVATQLYVDPDTKRPKPGSQTKNAGAVRRLADVLNQFDVTWDLYAMVAKELGGILPKEFEHFGAAPD
jgi:hypothetical protein